MAERDELDGSRVIGTRVARHDGVLDRARGFSRLMDTAFRVPGTQWRFGLDPLLGLVPGIGDVVGGGFSVYLLWLAARAGAPAAVLTRMAVNVGVDALVGAIPLLGDLFDAGWKANRRNMRILEGHIAAPDRTRSRSKGVLLTILALLLLLLAGVFWLAFALARALIGLVM